MVQLNEFLGYLSSVQGSVFRADPCSFIDAAGSCAQKGSVLGLMVDYYHFEILNSFWTKSPVFSFVTGPCESCRQSCLKVSYRIHYIENPWVP